jgi:hypothetical protein
VKKLEVANMHRVKREYAWNEPMHDGFSKILSRAFNALKNIQTSMD